MSAIRAITEEEKNKLIDLSLEARDRAYCPYSKFKVGAALLTEDGVWFKGAAICAERTAYVKAVSEGYSKFIALGVSSSENIICSPCGICRQFISEFGPKNLPVYLIKPDREYEIMTVEELLPNSFSPEETARFLQ
ncbi:hypothetical protein INT43_000559 [Umbelopsis isabellina]|uniref:Cytidine deaminase n=1 Tax=Mortierella isabellina TaxID=91625 RepID=A0A8H7Q2J2_MORIS|nr:hypothetical protein INT43_000559 [Umbelopsis isabellina]